MTHHKEDAGRTSGEVHYVIVERVRRTNALLARELEREFSRLENDRADAAVEIEELLIALQALLACAESECVSGSSHEPIEAAKAELAKVRA